MKKNRGVTLLTMGIAVIIMLIILSTITFNVIDRTKTKKLDNMYNDLRILSDKINMYYGQYGRLPIKEEYTQISEIPAEILNPNDYGSYYVIDLNAMENLSLSTEVTLENIFVMNEGSHTIYFPKGVKLDGVTYYRLPESYTKIETTVNFSYIIKPAEPSKEATIYLTIEELTNGLKDITYPDGTKKAYGEKTKTVEETYDVTENGDYKFEVTINNTNEKSEITIPVSNVDRTGPTYDRAETSNVTSAGYDVMIYGVTDPSGVEKVEMEVWTTNNGKDDVVKKNMSYQEDGNWYGRVDVEEHNNEIGSYETKIYMYDTLENMSEVTLSAVTVPEPPHTHSMGAWTKISDTEHQRSCSCGLTETANHTWGNYVKVNDETHKRTCTSCGAEQNTTHSFGSWVSASATQHKNTCLLCNATILKNHSFGSYTYSDANSHKQECSICSYSNVVSHTWSSFVDLDANSHSRTCSGCGTTQKANHSWSGYSSVNSSNHQRVCNVCRRSQTASHSWSSYSDEGNGTHRRTCSVCSAIESAAHSFGNWSWTSWWQHSKSCSVCGNTQVASHGNSGNWQNYNATNHRSICPTCKGYGYAKHEWETFTRHRVCKKCRRSDHLS